MGDEKPPTPIRGKNLPSSGSANGGGGQGGDDEADEVADDPVKLQLQQEALMPRTDIGPLITEQLIEQFNDKNWKERQAGLERLDTILRENKFIEPNLGELPPALSKRLTDTNKNLATQALQASAKLAQALGSQGRRFVSAMAPSIIQALSDAKETLRRTAVEALTAWYDNCGGITPFLEGDLLAEAFTKATNPNIKAELCGWLAAVLVKSKPVKAAAGAPDLKALVPTVFAYVEDRNPDVRTKSQELIMPIMLHVGVNEMLRAMNKAKVREQGFPYLIFKTMSLIQFYLLILKKI
jgi:cytoskeleton-associated protein 5